MNTINKSSVLILLVIVTTGCGNVLGQIHNYDEVITDGSLNGEWILMGMVKDGTETKQSEEARYTVISIDGGNLATVHKRDDKNERSLFFQCIKIDNKNYVQIPWDHGLNIIMKVDVINKNEMRLAFIDTDKLKQEKIDNINNVQSKVIRDLLIRGIDIFDDAKLRFVRLYG
jgi:hypothetical protein